MAKLLIFRKNQKNRADNYLDFNGCNEQIRKVKDFLDAFAEKPRQLQSKKSAQGWKFYVESFDSSFVSSPTPHFSRNRTRVEFQEALAEFLNFFPAVKWHKQARHAGCLRLTLIFGSSP